MRPRQFSIFVPWAILTLVTFRFSCPGHSLIRLLLPGTRMYSRYFSRMAVFSVPHRVLTEKSVQPGAIAIRGRWGQGRLMTTRDSHRRWGWTRACDSARDCWPVTGSFGSFLSYRSHTLPFQKRKNNFFPGGKRMKRIVDDSNVCYRKEWIWKKEKNHRLTRRAVRTPLCANYSHARTHTTTQMQAT